MFLKIYVFCWMGRYIVHGGDLAITRFFKNKVGTLLILFQKVSFFFS